MNKLQGIFEVTNSGCKYWTTLIVLCFALLASGCDGGLFGTGDGSGPIDLGGQSSSDGNVGVDGDDTDEPNPPADNGDENASAGDQNSSTQTTPEITFNNTTPAGLPSPSSSLPGVKLINLSTMDLLIQVSNDQSDALEDTELAQAGNTSKTQLLNNTGNQVSIQSSDTLEGVLSINPLTTASDSLTTVLVATGSDLSDQALDAFVFDTRAAVPADSTIQIRVVSLIDDDEPNTALTFVLEPTADNNIGAQLMFTDEQFNAISISDYALNNPGTYTLSVDNNAFLPFEVDLQTNEVYTLIITSDVQIPIYLENDTEEP